MRKYERLYCCPEHGPLIAGRKVCGWIGKDEDSGETVGCTLAEPVTATDDRDVMPLVEEARIIADVVVDVAPDADGFCAVPTRQLRALQAALQPFETEEKP